MRSSNGHDLLNFPASLQRVVEMITRSNLAEQLRDYQLRSSYQWKSLAFFSSTNSVSSRAEAIQAITLFTFFVALWIGSLMAIVFRRGWLAVALTLVAILMLLGLRLIRQNKISRRKQKGILP